MIQRESNLDHDTLLPLNVKKVSRSYRMKEGKRIVLDNVSFSVHLGEIVCVLGPNGAGKTTLVKIASSLLLPDCGEVEACGVDVLKCPRKACKHISLVLGGENGFYLHATAINNLRYFAQVSGVPFDEQESRIKNALQQVHLVEFSNQNVSTFSRGMRQRLHLARALISAHSLILLDEPTSGLDPNNAADVRRLIAELRHIPSGILLTSHSMREVELLADRVLVLKKGKCIFLGSLEELRQKVKIEGVYTFITDCLDESKIKILKECSGIASVEVLEKFDSIYVDVSGNKKMVFDLCVNDFGWKKVNERRASLEEVYLAVMGKDNERQC